MGRYDDRVTFSDGTNRNPIEVFVGLLPFKIRYIEVGSTGSTSNAGNHIVELYAFNAPDRTNVALGKPVKNNGSSTNPNDSYPLSRVTDGNTDTAIYAELGAGSAVTEVDLQAEYDISSIRLWRYYGDGRTYYQTYIKMYNGDKSQSAYVHNSAVSGTYPETSSGRCFPGNQMALGENTWGDDWKYLDLYVGDAAGTARRITRWKQLTTNYGDKQADQTSGGYLRLIRQRIQS